MTETIVYIIVCLLFSAFFSSIEISFVSADMLQVTVRQDQKDRIGRLLQKFYTHRDNFLTTTLIGNTISLVVYGVFFAKLMDPPLRQLIGEDQEVLLLLAQTVISTGVVLALAEFTPKYLGLIFSRNLKLLLILIQVMYPIYQLLRPFTWLVLKTNKLLMTRLLGVEQTQEKRDIRLEDISHFLRHAQAKDKDEKPLEIEAAIFDNALAFQNMRVRDCMVPRPDIVAVEINEPIERLRQLFLDSGHSKIIVYRESIDQVEGYCHAIRMYENPKAIADIKTDIYVTPETTFTPQLMRDLIAERKTIALVMDEFGGTAGIVTMEDIVEKILGQIEDEHDKPEESVQKVGENVFILNARHKVRELNEQHGWWLSEGDYETLGGYIIAANGRVPRTQDIVKTREAEIEILEVNGARISRVRVTLKPLPKAPHEDA